MSFNVENKGLLFIPDISGFTRFVNDTEIQHSRLIIQELLEILLNANSIGLEVSEIEGDAILFYKFGESPKPEVLYKQVETMFCEFNRHLMAYENRRYCWCKACVSAIDLRLKIISHYGEFTSYTVKNFKKLIGKDVIVAHQLLKNEIDQHEYWLVTKSLLDNPPSDLARWMQWNSSAKQTEIGPIPYHYTQLGELKNNIVPEEPNLEIPDKIKIISVSDIFNADLITMFHAVGDFNYRHRWMVDIRGVGEIAHLLPRVGMHCSFITDIGEIVIYSSGYSHTEDRIEFSETDEKKVSSRYYLLEKIDDNKTRFTLSFYLAKNVVTQSIFRIMKKKKMEENFKKSLSNITKLVEELKLPAAVN